MGTKETKSPFLRFMPARIGAGFFFLVLVAAGQQLQHEVTVINIAVPVRVYQGDRFVDNLKLEDFEVYEDGKPQKVLASYYIQKKGVERGESIGRFAAPIASRHFVMQFQMTEYFPSVDRALEAFFNDVYIRGDSLDVITPQRVFRLRDDLSTRALRAKAKEEIARKLRDDILIASGEIQSLVQSAIDALSSNEEGDPSAGLDAYENIMLRLEQMRAVETKNIIAFANELKRRPGAKHVFLFYQRETIPQYSDKKLTGLMSSPGIGAAEIFRLMGMLFYKRDAPLDRDAVKKAFSDASVDVHFLYVTKTQREEGLDVTRQRIMSDVAMKEHSEDIYAAFREIAAATGGISDTSANMDRLMRKAADASERYYLLYYRPEGYQADGAFREITVKVKGERGYRISHRAGYFAKEVPALPEVKEGEEISAAQPEAGEKTAEFVEGRPAEDLDLTGRKALEELLTKTSAYCKKLETAALDFVCREDVRERIYGIQGDIPIGGSRDMPIKMPGKALERIREWTYDYQLIRKGGLPEERRILLRENGKDARVENARLATTRFAYRTVFMGPVGLFGMKAQTAHQYKIVGKETENGESVVVIDVAPKEKNAESLFGQVRIRERDGAVLKVEWKPASMGNYESLVRFAREINAEPRIAFSSVYNFEKNGLRFPSAYEIDESYFDLDSKRKMPLSKTTVEYAEYKFFVVETGVRIGK